MLLYRYCFVLLCISKYQPPRAKIRRDDLTEGFLRYEFKGLIFGGAHSWRGLFSELYGIIGETNKQGATFIDPTAMPC